MNRKMISAIVSISLFGCSSMHVSSPSADAKDAKGPLVARAFFGNDACLSAPSSSAKESAFAAAAASWFVGKAAEAVVDYVADAVAEAAKQDSETFTITGQSADYLFYMKETMRMRGCLYVAVAPVLPRATKWCEDGKTGNWYSSGTCETRAELIENWKQYRLGEPVFFAEIGMEFPDSGPTTAAIPKAYKVHYPNSISSIPVDKVKGLTITVSAAKPTKSSKTSGDIVLEIFMGGDGVTPKTVSANADLKTSGLWVVIPPSDGKEGKEFAGPVNLSVTVAETQNPTKWLQSIAKYVSANRQKAIDSIVKNLDPAKKEEAAKVEATAAIKAEGVVAAACTALSVQFSALELAKKNVSSGSNNEEKLRSGYALDAACANAKTILANTKLAAPPAAGKTLCGRADKPEETLTNLCSH